MWVKFSERQPDKGGEYRVMRRGLRKRPKYEDRCEWTPPINATHGYWINSRGVVIQTVEEWWEEQ